MMVHRLYQPTDGCTHIAEGQARIHRGDRRITIEVLGGTAQDGEDGLPIPGTFAPHPRMTWINMGIGPDRWEDFEAFCEEFESDADQPPRSLLNRAVAAALEYLWRVDAGLRPLLGPDNQEEENGD